MKPEGWQRRKIREFSERLKRINTIGLDLEPLSITKDRGVILQSEKYHKRIATDSRKYLLADDGDFAFDPMSLYYGAIGRVGGIGRGLVSPDYVVFKTDDSVDGRFLNALLRYPEMNKLYESLSETGNSFGKRRRLYWSIFEDIDLLLPPRTEQRKIAAILSSVDEAIQATQAVIDQLQLVKKAMMAELLTRGLPGRHTRFKATEIGEVPEEWEVVALGTLARVTSGGTPSRDRPEYWGGTVPWVKTGEVNYADVLATEEAISEAGVANSAAKIVPKGSLLMAMYGQGATRGRVAILGLDAALNQACLAVLEGERIKNRFLFHVLAARYDELRILGNEGSQKNLNAGLVKGVAVPVPPLDEQAEIIGILSSIDARAESEKVAAVRLGELKAALMSVLLTGEVRVKPDEEAA